MDEYTFSNGLHVEHLLKRVLGDSVHGMATPYQNPRYFKKDVKKFLNKIDNDIDKLVANEKFKDSAHHDIEKIIDQLKTAQSPDDYRNLFIYTLGLATSLLGYHYQSAGRLEEPYFIPSVWQEMQGWNGYEEYMKRKDKLTLKRSNTVKSLKEDGLTNAEVAQVMNLTNYRLAQIIKELKASGELH